MLIININSLILHITLNILVGNLLCLLFTILQIISCTGIPDSSKFPRVLWGDSCVAFAAVHTCVALGWRNHTE